jgi:DNA repair protein SbcC/Rad50
MLDLLHELSADRQVIVFSQEDDVLAWALGTMVEPKDRLVELAPVLAPH